MADLILALDQGTTSSRAVIFDSSSGEICALHGVPFQQHYPAKGWVAHDLDEIWASTLTAINGAIHQLAADPKGRSHKDIRAIGITNQRETTCIFEPGSGRPLSKAIVWQCKRSLEICRDWQRAGLADSVRERTGLRLDPYFSASKVGWWCGLDSSAAVDASLKAKLADGSALIGTIDTYLLYKLTGGKAYKTEPSNASRTMLYDLREGQFSKDLIRDLGLPATIRLPEVVPSDSCFGVSLGLNKGIEGLADGIPITGILGDQQAALFGQGCLSPGEGKCTYGTGAFLLVNIGDTLPDPLPEQLLTTAFYEAKGQRMFALEGAAFIAGAAVDYLQTALSWIDSPRQADQLMAQHPAAPELYFVPGFAGLGSPHWVPDAQGAYLGLSRDTTKEQLVAATLEGIAFTVDDMLSAMSHYQALSTLKVDGGLSQSEPLMRFQAAISELEVAVSQSPEATALGAGFMAAVGAGLTDDIGQFRHTLELGARYSGQPQGLAFDRKKSRRGWQAAIAAVKAFAEHKRSP